MRLKESSIRHMKILVFTDIHGNYEILKELFSTEDFRLSDLRICLGDSIDLDMQNNDCLRLLKESRSICTYGNYEARLYDWYSEPNRDKNAKKNNEIKSSLNKQSLDYLKTFTKEIQLNLHKSFKFCHYKWANDNELVLRENLNYEYITSIYRQDNFDFIIFGHEHNSCHFVDGNKHMICIGSLGLKCPAPYLLIEVNIDPEFFFKFNTNYIAAYGYPELKITPNLNLKSTFDSQKTLYQDDKIKISLKYINYDLVALKKIYNTSKYQKRNFDLIYLHN